MVKLKSIKNMKDAKGNFVFQIIKNLEDNTSYLYLMHEAVIKSTYNKLFHLNLMKIMN